MLSCGRLLQYWRCHPGTASTAEAASTAGADGRAGGGRRGDKKDTKGTAYVVYEDIFDAKQAQEHLSGFNLSNRYLIVLFHNRSKSKKVSAEAELQRLRELQRKHGVDGKAPTGGR